MSNVEIEATISLVTPLGSEAGYRGYQKQRCGMVPVAKDEQGRTIWRNRNGVNFPVCSGDPCRVSKIKVEAVGVFAHVIEAPFPLDISSGSQPSFSPGQIEVRIAEPVPAAAPEPKPNDAQASVALAAKKGNKRPVTPTTVEPGPAAA